MSGRKEYRILIYMNGYWACAWGVGKKGKIKREEKRHHFS